MDEQLVLFDCDRIKEYVFATGRLKEIRGASQLVKDLTEEAGLKERFPALIGKARIIYADGGAGKIVFPSPEDAEAFRQCLEADYRRETVTGTVTTSCVSIGNGFSIAVRDGERELRRQKEARREWQQLAPGPYIR
ncbi:MAG: hypothetical protein FJY85_20015, partial [Deltaproteobacteria bacterium]|nr:hypothetical protein [Deltaproteobacteria bacterium]